MMQREPDPVSRRRAAWGLAAALLAAVGVAAPSGPAASADTPLERGRYLVEVVMQCGSCHDTPGPGGRADPAMRQAGGRVFGNVGLRAVTPNITPHVETGIGAWTEGQFADAMRNGRRPDGSLIGPPMPVEAYRGISDSDLAAVWAYLRTIPPVSNAVTERSTFPRSPTRFDTVASVPQPMADPVRRGEYLAVALLHCMDCHSPRIALDRADPARIGSGGRVFQTGAGPPLPARNITSHPEAGIGNWTDEEVWRAIAEAIGNDGRRLHSTMSSRAAGWSRMTTRDRADLLAYLRALPPLE